MISRDFLRKEFDRLPHLFRQRNVPAGALEEWRDIDAVRRMRLTQVEAVRAARNSLSQKIGAKRRAGEDSAGDEQLSKEIATQTLSLEAELKALTSASSPSKRRSRTFRRTTCRTALTRRR